MTSPERQIGVESGETSHNVRSRRDARNAPGRHSAHIGSDATWRSKYRQSFNSINGRQPRQPSQIHRRQHSPKCLPYSSPQTPPMRTKKPPRSISETRRQKPVTTSIQHCYFCELIFFTNRSRSGCEGTAIWPWLKPSSSNNSVLGCPTTCIMRQR